ncbi:unnamed protein product, partial [Vitis vinifera]|uniref:GDSL esterase/lipase 5 n=1 Tax=Vitis vinifera TaxID=29760 RepID=D7TZL4_VITVI
MASLSFHTIHVLVFCAYLLISTSSQSLPHQPKKHATLFIFGDSLYDAGNNNYINTTTDYQANFWPYGETFFGYPAGRFLDGRLIPDFIAEYGANFASAGAGALNDIHQGSVINLNTQLSYIVKAKKQLRQKLGDEATKKMLSEAVYLTSIGSNDYLSPLLSNSVFQSYSYKKQYIHMVIGNLTVVIKEIYKQGGRKFGFVNSAPLGCTPVMETIKLGGNGEYMEEATMLARLHIRAFSKVLQKLESKLKGFKYSISNFYTLLEERMDNPSKYDFKEGKTACCGWGPYRGLLSCGGKRTIKEYELCSNVSKCLLSFSSFY